MKTKCIYIVTFDYSGTTHETFELVTLACAQHFGTLRCLRALSYNKGTFNNVVPGGKGVELNFEFASRSAARKFQSLLLDVAPQFRGIGTRFRSCDTYAEKRDVVEKVAA